MKDPRRREPGPRISQQGIQGENIGCLRLSQGGTEISWGGVFPLGCHPKEP